MSGRWDWLTLADVLIKQSNNKPLQQGWSPKCHAHPASVDSWGVLKTTAIQAGWFDPSQNKELPETLDPRAQIEVQAGDLLMTCAGPRSRCGVPTLVRHAPPKLMISGKMYRFRPDERLDSRFLELWLLSPDAQRKIDSMKTGISDSGLNLTHDRFLKLPVPVPPLAEQIRIVGMVEDHLSRLDAAAWELTSVGARCVAWQESWLRTHLEINASRMVRLGDRLVDVKGGWSRSRNHLVGPGEGPAYLKMNNITRRGRLDLSDLVHVQASEEELENYGVRPGDVLFNSKNSGDLVGKTTVADNNVAGAVLNENIMRLRFDDRVMPEFAAMWFLGPIARRHIADATRASTNVAAVYQNRLVEFPMWVPDVAIQRSLVNEFEALRSAAERLEARAATLIRRSTATRRSILTAAFSGRLTGHASDAVKEEVDLDV